MTQIWNVLSSYDRAAEYLPRIEPMWDVVKDLIVGWMEEIAELVALKPDYHSQEANEQVQESVLWTTTGLSRNPRMRSQRPRPIQGSLCDQVDLMDSLDSIIWTAAASASRSNQKVSSTWIDVDASPLITQPESTESQVNLGERLNVEPGRSTISTRQREKQSSGNTGFTIALDKLIWVGEDSGANPTTRRTSSRRFTHSGTGLLYPGTSSFTTSGSHGERSLSNVDYSPRRTTSVRRTPRAVRRMVTTEPATTAAASIYTHRPSTARNTNLMPNYRAKSCNPLLLVDGPENVLQTESRRTDMNALKTLRQNRSAELYYNSRNHLRQLYQEQYVTYDNDYHDSGSAVTTKGVQEKKAEAVPRRYAAATVATEGVQERKAEAVPHRYAAATVATEGVQEKKAEAVPRRYAAATVATEGVQERKTEAVPHQYAAATVATQEVKRRVVRGPSSKFSDSTLERDLEYSTRIGCAKSDYIPVAQRSFFAASVHQDKQRRPAVPGAAFQRFRSRSEESLRREVIQAVSDNFRTSGIARLLKKRA